MSKYEITLTPLRGGDSKILYDWINDRELRIKSSYYTPISEIQHEKWFEHIQTNDSVFIFAIRCKGRCNDQLFGTCQLYNINWVYRSAMIQIRIGPAYQHQGVGSQAIQKLLGFAFNDLNLNRIYLDVFETNTNAIGLYEKMGFTREGLLRQAIYIDGEYRNMIIMGLTREEWKK
jgi:RimJ/RimL family protein N-acetyltransferase